MKHREELMATASEAAMAHSYNGAGTPQHKEGTYVQDQPTPAAAEPDDVKQVRKKRHASAAEIVAISEMLKAHVNVTGPRQHEYKGDMHDGRIAELVNIPGIKYDHVRRVRESIYGLRPSKHLSVNDKVSRLEQMFNKLAEEIGSDLRID